MAQFALRLDGGGPFRARGDLEIGWSGDERDLAWCRWENTKAFFIDNSIRTAIPLEHIQGQLENVNGWSNGMALEVEGVLKLESVSFMGQQITQLESPFHVQEGQAKLDSIRGHYLGGEVLGDDACTISLDATPRYHVVLSLKGLSSRNTHARSRAGNPTAATSTPGLRSTDWAATCGASAGAAKPASGRADLGELPPVLRLASFLNSVPNMTLASGDKNRAPGKTAFDSADVNFSVSGGTTTFDPIKFTGNALSLLGRGTLDPQGYLDLRLNLLWGRDRFHIPLVSEFARRASTPFFVAHVKGTPSNLQFGFEPLPPVGDALRALNRSRTESQAE